jgi:anti-sigma factor RsiW
MSCPETLRTQAYLDGELDGALASDAERHIEGCADCQALSADVANLSDAIRLGATRHAAPPLLRAQIRKRIEVESTRSTPASRRSFWMGAAGGAGISALAAAFAIMMILLPSAETLAQSVTDAHTSAMLSGHMIQVVSSNHHTVKPWFATHIAVSPPVADFAADGFTLVGGRVDDVAGMQTAVVVYRHGKHQIDLFVWADKGSTLPANSIRHGYHSVFWKKGDLDFAAVSDVDPTELKKFIALVRSEPE